MPKPDKDITKKIITKDFSHSVTKLNTDKSSIFYLDLCNYFSRLNMFGLKYKSSHITDSDTKVIFERFSLNI